MWYLRTAFITALVAVLGFGVMWITSRHDQADLRDKCVQAGGVFFESSYDSICIKKESVIE